MVVTATLRCTVGMKVFGLISPLAERLGSAVLRSAAEQRRLQPAVRLQLSRSQLRSVYPVEQKKNTYQGQGAGNG
jgi:hypothetical protein